MTIAQDTLPQSCLSYIAFRISFLDTLDRIVLAQQFGMLHSQDLGYLTQVPFLKCVAPHVQLDLLLEAWSKHMDPNSLSATLVDESIVYAVCENAAEMVEQESAIVKRFLRRGPLPVNLVVDQQLASELRSLHLRLSNEGDFLLISQFEDLDPEEALPLKKKFGLDLAGTEMMFETLGRWHVSRERRSHWEYLLLDSELKQVEELFSSIQSEQVD